MTGLPRQLRGYLLSFAVTIILTGLPTALGAEPLTVETTRVPLDPQDTSRLLDGALEYRGGIRLTSPDKRFGGLSGLRISSTGKRFVAVSDTGWWLVGTLVYGKNGWLRDVRDTEIRSMTGTDGKPLRSKSRADAEALEIVEEGFLVSFEREHRIWRYPVSGFALPAAGVAPTQIPTPIELANAPSNGGLEAMVSLSDGGLLIVTESFTAEGGYRGWIASKYGDRFHDVTYAKTGIFHPTDLVRLPSGDVLALERRYTRTAGPGARVLRITGSSIRPSAVLSGKELLRLTPPETVDNFEGLAIAPAGDGGVFVFLLSDDNFNRLQRTLLLAFHLANG